MEDLRRSREQQKEVQEMIAVAASCRPPKQEKNKTENVIYEW